MAKFENKEIIDKYVADILSGKKLVNKYQRLGVERYKRMLNDKRYDFNPKDAEFVIAIIEGTIVHKQGERLDGTPLMNAPFLLEPFHKFQIYNLLGFYHKGTKIRKHKEAFIYIPRKNIKTSFAAALTWALGILERKSGAKAYIVARALKQSLESFDFLKHSIKQMGDEDTYRIIDNNAEHSISRQFNDGSFYIQALAANPDSQDSFNCNIAIADEMHAYKTPKQYNIIKEAMKAYTNKLMIGITTAGDNMNSFCYNRLQYCKKILDGTVEDEQYYVFIAEADEDENGYLDFTNAKVHEMANPAYGVSIRPEDIMNDAMQALNDPQQRKDFLAKSLNVYTSSVKAYFNLDEFRKSDEAFEYGYKKPIIIHDEETVNYKELAKLNVKWFGGVDLSKLYDLTGVCLYGELDGVGICITHGFIPVVTANEKADKDQIPYFSWQDSGWLSMINSPVIEYDDVVKWFIKMRDYGFDIKEIGFDRQFAKEFVQMMEEHDFNMKDVSQRYWIKNIGFRHIEAQVKKGAFYYLHSDAYEYCVENVKAMEDPEERVRYEKTSENLRIDLFDASVIAVVRFKESLTDESVDIDGWFD
ncbi:MULTISPECIES: terminase large subunit [unclassified Breznakia]|uniref:terminase large subunit n=1 Tax=unclassified Breznakia TaxID=2623764 RepID=UPI002475874B|nr:MULTISPECIES: terminase large subunit [unclassified Breznakia]MDH6367142.1 phage terminase large subunit-like protein [Breznakia sp. PH1-1]MDH6404271.1 phage terminase large subunit-like protein [Breznakia sp. PF1-11]MDH6412030.1 phage terminase large subunit-like protein [Breznakia sp. PFB1-11]MDH6414259.1 phage terminase large subunit-like protein [Breznakia sp. PFB1-14]MDH6416644.1 phage terminase large subunit-like protein [Breznakia sp. PFB1-4]